jgi:sugar phosphate isomerase/epimerase
MKAALDRLGLKAVGSHTGINLLKNKLDEVIEYNLEIGNKYVICPWNSFKSKDDYIKTAHLFNEIGTKCRENELQLGYHNHDHEFEKIDGEYGLDILFNGTKPENLTVEIDTCWAFYAGINPSDYVRKYKGRVPLVHIKDLKSRGSKEFSDIGQGVVDIPAIVKAANNAGSEWLVVEIDTCPRQSLESAKIGFDYLKSLK